MAGNLAWLEEKDWRDFTDYEAAVDNVIAKQLMIAICSYPVGKCGVAETVDVIRSHKFAPVRRQGKWELQESLQAGWFEKTLDEMKERYTSIVEISPEVIFGISPDGTLISLNPVFEQVTGWSPAKMLDKPFMPLIHHDDQTIALEKFLQGLRGESPEPFEVRLLSAASTANNRRQSENNVNWLVREDQ